MQATIKDIAEHLQAHRDTIESWFLAIEGDDVVVGLSAKPESLSIWFERLLKGEPELRARLLSILITDYFMTGDLAQLQDTVAKALDTLKDIDINNL